jgi:predicted alpha/beta hydrolase family esterase
LKNHPLRSPSDEESVKKWPHTLRTALGEDYQVFMPSFPNSNNSQYDEWKIWFEKHFEYLTNDIILVCWSQGGMFIAKYLSENEVPFTIKSLILLAAPFDYFVCEGSKEDGGDFYPVATNVPKIQQKVQNITIMHSKDDFAVPYEHALKYKAALPEAELVTFEDKNHFLLEELPELVERIKSLS